MSLSLISESYFVGSDSEDGGGNEEGEGYGLGVEQKVQLPLGKVEDVKQESDFFPPEDKLYPQRNLEELCGSATNGLEAASYDSDNDDKPAAKDPSLSPRVLESDSNFENTGSSEATEIFDKEAGVSSTPTSDKYFSGVSPRRKWKRFGNWMSSYRRRQQGRHRWRPAREKTKTHDLDLVHTEVDPVGGQDERNSTSTRSGIETDYSTPSPVALSSPRRKAELFKCPYCLETFCERNELIKHLEIHQVNHSKGRSVTSQPASSNVHHTSAIPTSKKQKRRAKKSAKYKCHKCSDIFGHQKNLVRHMKLHSGIGRPWKCSKCDCAFPHKKSLRQHEHRRHGGTDPSTYTCAICKIPFYSEETIEKHRMTVHQEKGRPWKCSLCPSYFLFAGHLKKHENRVHNMERDLTKMECQICGIAYTTGHFSSHMRIHEEKDRPWECSRCPSFFNSEGQLRFHENQIHNRIPGQTRSPCNICGKMLCRWELTAHMKLHVKSGRPWNCPICNYYFPTKIHLRNHTNSVHGRLLKTSGGSRSSKCLICKIPFSKTSNLKTHMLQVHQDKPEKPWKCSLCPSFFVRFSSLTCHENRVHGKKIEPLPCPLCQQQFKHRKSVFTHLRNMHGVRKTSALLELLQTSKREPETAHFPPSKHTLRQVRPCKLELTRCDHLIPKFTRSPMAAVGGRIENRESANKLKSQFGQSKIKLLSKTKDNDAPSEEDESVITENTTGKKLRRTGLPTNGFGVTEGVNSVDQSGKMYTCPYCLESFIEPTMLIEHLPFHTGDELKQEQAAGGEPHPEVLDEVSQRLPEAQSKMNSDGNRHSLASTQKLEKVSRSKMENSYQCKHCNYSCRQAQVLHNHVKVHSEEGRPFKCSPCGYNFTSFQSLRIHEGNYHKGTKPTNSTQLGFEL